jgi:NAD(P)-dependent dehydrogenase (short-subunit alcohol dehydrogenase family)
MLLGHLEHIIKSLVSPRDERPTGPINSRLRLLRSPPPVFGRPKTSGCRLTRSTEEMAMSRKNRLAVVTGASSGIGEATARALAARGFHVLAGARREADADRLAAGGVEPVILDITDPTHVAAIAERVEQDANGVPLGVLVNNAGIAVNAPVETIPMQEWRRQFEVNFFGHVAVTQALLPALLAARGRIVNVSSIGGRVAAPTFGAYAASKFALEAMSDALRREVRRLGVQVIVVEPGTVATPIWGKGIATAEGLVAGMTDEQQARYRDVIAGARGRAQTLERSGVEPADAARVIVDAIEAPRPHARYLVGRDAKVMARMVRLLPDGIVDRLIARNLRPPSPDA